MHVDQGGVSMGDNAEYQVELDAETRSEAELGRQEGLDASPRPLLSWVEGELACIWEWEPSSRVRDVFGRLHRDLGLGSAAFFSDCVPSEDEIGDALDRCYVSDTAVAEYEVVVMSQDDRIGLLGAISELRRPNNAQCDQLVGDMLEEMLEFIESNPAGRVFVFARTL